VRHFAKLRYGLGTADLEMLLYLRTEKYFTKDKFDEFGSIMSFDTQRFKRLRREGWIDSFRIHTTKRKALYTVSYKTIRMIASIYNKLDGKEPLPTSREMNPMMIKKNQTYMNRQMLKAANRMNEAIQQQQHPSPE
jgi:hypothetical protein